MSSEQRVYAAMARALGNGYDLRAWDTEAICNDLALYESDLEGLGPEVLGPAVEKWLTWAQEA